MFTNISWGNYIVVVTLLLTGWYLFVGLRFYFPELKMILAGKGLHVLKRPLAAEEATPVQMSDVHQIGFADAQPVESSFAASDPTFQDVDDLIEKLKTATSDGALRKLPRDEFLDKVRLLLSEYPSVKNSPFRSSVSEFIVTEFDTLELPAISQWEAEQLWD